MAAEELRNAGLLARGDLSKDELDESMARLKSVMDTLQWLKKNREAFLAFCKNPNQERML